MLRSTWQVQTPWGNLTNFRDRSEAFKVFRALAFKTPGWVIIGKAGDTLGWGAFVYYDGLELTKCLQ
jgi:hypothetical protein